MDEETQTDDATENKPETQPKKRKNETEIPQWGKELQTQVTGIATTLTGLAESLSPSKGKVSPEGPQTQQPTQTVSPQGPQEAPQSPVSGGGEGPQGQRPAKTATGLQRLLSSRIRF